MTTALAHNSLFQQKMRDAVFTAAALKRGSGLLAAWMEGLLDGCLTGTSNLVACVLFEVTD
jgi:hypothetical protein